MPIDLEKIKEKAMSPFRKNHRRRSHAAALSSVLDGLIQFKAVDLGYTYGSENMCSPSGDMDKKHYPSLYVSDRENDIDLPLSGEAKVKFKLRSKTSRQDENGKKRHSADIEIHSIDVIKEPKQPKEGQAAKQIAMSSKTREVRFARGKHLGRAIGVNLKNSPARGSKEASATAKALMSVRKTLKRKGAKSLPEAMSVRGLNSRLDSIVKFGDPRPRNPLGEFANQNEDVPDPNTMAKTYRSGIDKGLVEGAGFATLGGAGAAAGGTAMKSLLSKLRRTRK